MITIEGLTITFSLLIVILMIMIFILSDKINDLDEKVKDLERIRNILYKYPQEKESIWLSQDEYARIRNEIFGK